MNESSQSNRDRAALDLSPEQQLASATPEQIAILHDLLTDLPDDQDSA